MRNTVAVMNTKGGVGKSTLVLTVAETLSAVFRKNVLIIDSDSQASVSAMLLSASNLHRLQSDGLTIVDLLVASVLNNVAVDWPEAMWVKVGSSRKNTAPKSVRTKFFIS